MNDRKLIAKSIYLDWNIFQDLIHKRRSPRLAENIGAAKEKGFVIPYSNAHMSDLSRSNNLEFIKNDLQQVEAIAQNKYIRVADDYSDVSLQNTAPQLILDVIKRINAENPASPEIPRNVPTFRVAIEEIPSGNLFLSYLKEFDGMMCWELLVKLMDDIKDKGLVDYTLQRNFRNSFIEIVKIGNPAAPQLLETPLIKFMFSDKTEIRENFLDIFTYYLSINGKKIDTIGEQEKFTLSYGLLDFFPVFKEKIEKRNNMNNMLTDALHVYFASKCSSFVCGDDALIEKAEILYRLFSVRTKVYHVEKFIGSISY